MPSPRVVARHRLHRYSRSKVHDVCGLLLRSIFVFLSSVFFLFAHSWGEATWLERLGVHETLDHGVARDGLEGGDLVPGAHHGGEAVVFAVAAELHHVSHGLPRRREGSDSLRPERLSLPVETCIGT